MVEGLVKGDDHPDVDEVYCVCLGADLKAVEVRNVFP
jgi:hypothetical protein